MEHSGSPTNNRDPPTIQLIEQLQCDPALCGVLDDTEIWSPLATLGDVTPNSSSHPPSRLSSNNTALSSPSSELCLSANSSAQTTPLPSLTGEKKFSYSPTASVEACEISGCHSNTLELSQIGGGSPVSSGRTTPVKSTGNTPRSFRHIVNDIFRRSNVANEDKEEFTNISPSEIDAIIDKNASFTRSETVSTKSTVDKPRVLEPVQEMSSSMRILEPVQGMNSSMRVLERGNNRASVIPSVLPMSLPTIKDFNALSAQSYPNEQVLLKARERLNSFQSVNDSIELPPGYYRNHSNSFLASYESLSTITSHDEDMTSSILIHRTLDSTDKTNNHGNGIVGMVLSPLSPVAALDEYIQNGNILHVGRLIDVPVTDLSGINWDHYGACPHSEELKIKTGLAAILHSQVLLERYQCQQHARRNRRLMSKARTTTKLENEVLALVRNY